MIENLEKMFEKEILESNENYMKNYSKYCESIKKNNE